VSLQSALVYAGGTFAISRPVNGGFVLFKGEHSHRNTDFIVNPNQMGYDAKSRGFWPGVMPSLTPYRIKTIRTQPVNPPLGASLDKTEFALLPGYKSGYRLAIGSKAAATVLGTLQDAEGEPLGYQPLEIVSLDAKNPAKISSFTNAGGKFLAPGLAPGSYEIRITDGGYQAVPFKVGKNQEGLIQLGVLTSRR
jgi:outer membrane usher protein